VLRPELLLVGGLMRIALISDIHANLPALEAVLEHEAVRNADAVYHVGDLVGYGPWPNEVVTLIGKNGIAGVAGNYDSTVGTDYVHCGCKYEDSEQERLSHVSYEWTRAHVSPETRAWLRALPFRLDVRPHGGHASGPCVILVHGTPTLNTLYWTEDRDDAFCLKMAAAAGAKSGDVIAFGHTHLPWQRTIEGIHFVNTGSVGRPKDKDPRAGFNVVEFGETTSIEHIRCDYDVERAAAGIRASELPDFFADFLLSGGM
jgi:predicted phosphodiesterase